MQRAAKNRERLYRVTCPVCGRVEVLEEGPHETEETLLSMGWQWSSQISNVEHEWFLVCPRHYKAPGSRVIYNDAENDPQRVELPLIRVDDPN